MLIEALRQVPLFGQLSQEQLHWLSEQGTEVWLQPGEQIARQGDPPDGFYIILKGQTEWTRTVEGQSVYAVTLGAGDVFAELILLLDEPYPTSGRALTAVNLYKLSPDAFWEMLHACPNVLRGILKISAQRFAYAIASLHANPRICKATASEADFPRYLICRSCPRVE